MVVTDATNIVPKEETDALDAAEKLVSEKNQVPQDHKSFGAMNGVKLEIELSTEETNEPQTVPQPEEIVTTRVISGHPLLKAAVIGSGFFLVVAVAGGMINASMNALSNSTTAKPQPIKQVVSADDKDLESQSENPGKIKTALAITSQKPELESLRNSSKSTSIVKEKEAVKEPNPVVKTPLNSTTSTPTASPAIRRQDASVSQAQPIVKRKNHTLEPASSRGSASTSFSTPTPKIIPELSGRSALVSTANKQNLDPMQQWLAVSNIGSFSANSTEATTEQSINPEGLSGGTGTPKLVAFSSSNVAEETSIHQSSNVDYNAKRVIVGTRTEGKIETPVVISPGNTNQAQKYLIRLTKPLNASDGTEVLPTNSYLVVVLNNTNTSEYIQMSPIEALINVNGQTKEKNIPENSILILNKDGETLRGQSRKGSNLGSDLMTAVIAGVSKAAEVENNPSSQTTISNNGYSTSTVNNDNKNLLSGFTQGSFSQILQSIQSSNQQQIQSLSSENKVFVVPANTTVKIFVNQTISL